MVSREDWLMSVNFDDLERRGKLLRAHAVKMVHHARASHLGSCLSTADVLACLYWRVLRIDPSKPDWIDRDRLILSKGHAAAILYAALAERGFFSTEELSTYCQVGSRLTGHVTSGVPGVELSSGSLGHGLPVSCGIALAAKREGAEFCTFVLMSDGELDEGSNWESFLFAPQHELDNLVVIVDYNKIQSFGRTKDVLDLDPLADKLIAFRWGVREVDGHDYRQLIDAFDAVPFKPGRPSIIIAHTLKGKGVSFMENQLSWHYSSPDDQQLQRALEEIGADL
jgi:transketolase